MGIELASHTMLRVRHRYVTVCRSWGAIGAVVWTVAADQPPLTIRPDAGIDTRCFRLFGPGCHRGCCRGNERPGRWPHLCFVCDCRVSRSAGYGVPAAAAGRVWPAGRASNVDDSCGRSAADRAPLVRRTGRDDDGDDEGVRGGRCNPARRRDTRTTPVVE